MPLPLLPLLSAAIPSVISAFGQSASNRQQNQGALAAQELANQHNINFWRMQNEYNSPNQQMDRLRSAGLNPNLIYGTSPTSAVGNAGPVAPAKAAPYEVKNPLSGINLAPLTNFADIEVKKAQANNLATQNTVLIQEAALKAANTANTIADTAIKGTTNERQKFDLQLAQELKQTSLDAAMQNLKNLQQQTIGQELDNRFKDQGMKDKLIALYYQGQTARQQLNGQMLQNELLSLERDLQKLGITKNDPWYFRILGRNNEVLKGIGDGLSKWNFFTKPD